MAMRSSLGKLGGGLKAGCNPPTASAKFGEPSQFSRIAMSPVSTNFFSSRESYKRRVERGRALIEIDHADGVHLQAHQIVLPFGQDRRDLGQNQQPQPRAEFQHDTQIRRDQRRRAPGDLHHRPEQMMAVGRREDFIQVAEDLRRVADRIFRKHHAVQRVILEPGAQRRLRRTCG